VDRLKYKLTPTHGLIFGIVGIAVSIVGFFAYGVWLGIVAALLGGIGLFAGERKAAYLAVFLGVIVLILAIV